MMQYFVKENQIHRYPEPRLCSVRHEHEILRDTVPHGVKKCEYCMHWWPDDEKKPQRPLQ